MCGFVAFSVADSGVLYGVAEGTFPIGLARDEVVFRQRTCLPNSHSGGQHARGDERYITGQTNRSDTRVRVICVKHGGVQPE